VTPTPAQYSFLTLIRQIITSRGVLAWIKPSYIMAEVAIESDNWDPNSKNPTTSSWGLMQVQVGTVAEVVRDYALGSIGPQTDPLTSLETGTLYFNTCARKIIAARGARSLYLEEIAEAYQQGWAGFLAGKRNPRYGLKMIAQQAQWAFADSSVWVTM
jgi:hypothetical protein